MEEYAFFRGDGVGTPLGIRNSSAIVQITRSAGNTVALADLSDMVAHLIPGSYNSGAWFMSPTVLDQVLQLVSNPLTWLQNMRDSWQGMALLGYPIYLVGGLPALGTSGDIMLIDPNYYLIGDHKAGMSIAFSQHYRFVNDQVAWRITKRVAGMPLLDSAPYLEDASTQVSPYIDLS
jgi:HK97 family phage major capsid protein